MMGVHFQIAFACEGQVGRGMLGEQREHVVEERDARLDRRLPASINIQFKGDI